MGVSGVPLQNKHPHFYSQHSICPLHYMRTEALGNTMDLREQRQKKKYSICWLFPNWTVKHKGMEIVSE